jgi:hypothetical protein
MLVSSTLSMNAFLTAVGKNHVDAVDNAVVNEATGDAS